MDEKWERKWERVQICSPYSIYVQGFGGGGFPRRLKAIQALLCLLIRANEVRL